MKKIEITLFGTIIFILGVYLGFWFKGFMVVDVCIDHGGVWNEQKSTCEFFDEEYFQANLILIRNSAGVSP